VGVGDDGGLGEERGSNHAFRYLYVHTCTHNALDELSFSKLDGHRVPAEHARG
jgi:hypothetical protein